MKQQITCTFLGLGLIGGSVARALKLHNNHIFIKIFDTDANTSSLALREHIADEVYTSITHELCQCDYLFLCAPVSINLKNLETIYNFIPKNCIVIYPPHGETWRKAVTERAKTKGFQKKTEK